MEGNVNLICEPLKCQNVTIILNVMVSFFVVHLKSKGKGIPRQTELALGVPGRLRSRIISTFNTTRVVGRQP
jgi:hypothetical protein